MRSDQICKIFSGFVPQTAVCGAFLPAAEMDPIFSGHESRAIRASNSVAGLKFLKTGVIACMKRKKRRIRKPAAWLLVVPAHRGPVLPDGMGRPAHLIPVGKAVGIKLFCRWRAGGVYLQRRSVPGPRLRHQEGDLIVAATAKGSRPPELQACCRPPAERLQPWGLRRVSAALPSPLCRCRRRMAPSVWAPGLGTLWRAGTPDLLWPDTGGFGALGHGITDMDTAQLMSLGSGSIMETTVKAVKKGEKGDPAAQGRFYCAAGCWHGDSEQ